MSYRRFAHRVAVFAIGMVACVTATPGPAATATPGPTATATPGVVASDIVPHRAIYRLSLLSARNSSTVANVTGAMMFKWGDACDAWTVEQNFSMDFVYTEGEEVHMTTNYTTWEAKSGASYRFNVRKTVNGEVDEEDKGGGTMDSGTKGGTVHLDKPEPGDHPLAVGTLFPTRHTLVLLEQALAGEHLVMRTVFDGAEAEGPSEVSAVIGKRILLKDGVGVAVASKDRPSREVLIADAKRGNQLLSGAAWPVRLAFFPDKSDSWVPEYEMSMLLLHNGIVEGMQIDYGDFTINAVLETLEPLAKSGC